MNKKKNNTVLWEKHSLVYIIIIVCPAAYTLYNSGALKYKT